MSALDVRSLSKADFAVRPHCIHHVNFPITDVERTKAWYGKVFGMKHVDVSHLTNTKVLLMSRGHFELHFTPLDAPHRMAPFHFAIELEDWDAFMKHLDTIGVRHTKPVERPQNQYKFCYIHDPDGNMVELTYHADRP